MAHALHLRLRADFEEASVPRYRYVGARLERRGSRTGVLTAPIAGYQVERCATPLPGSMAPACEERSRRGT